MWVKGFFLKFLFWEKKDCLWHLANLFSDPWIKLLPHKIMTCQWWCTHLLLKINTKVAIHHNHLLLCSTIMCYDSFSLIPTKQTHTYTYTISTQNSQPHIARCLCRNTIFKVLVCWNVCYYVNVVFNLIKFSAVRERCFIRLRNCIYYLLLNC